MKSDMSTVVRTITDFIFGFIIVFGIYIIIHGHLTPGGGFQGGAVVASGFALFFVAFTHDFNRKKPQKLYGMFESIGLIIFILLAFFGIYKTFFYNFLANSGSLFGMTIRPGINPGYFNTGGVVPLMNMAVGFEVACGLSLIVYLLYRGEKKDREDSESE